MFMERKTRYNEIYPMKQVPHIESFSILSTLYRCPAYTSHLAASPSGKVVVTFPRTDPTTRNPDAEFRFRTQLEILRGIPHPHLDRILDVRINDGAPCVISEYHEGKTLRSLLAARTASPGLQKAVDCMRAAADGLSWAHAHTIVHLGLTADSIVVPGRGNSRDFGGVILKDFGIADLTRYDDSIPAAELLPLFFTLAPEQLGCIGRDPDHRSDIYALGVIFYRLVAGRYPFETDNLHALIQHHLHRPPPPLRRGTQRVPVALERIILKMIDKDPAARYASASALRDDLDAVKNRSGPTVIDDDPVRIPSIENPGLIGREHEFRKIKDDFES
ncbi:MAG TPA: serine/threonine protein kinase, partial [Spirochaetia bacterium]|nr:serine/threonine protein kinase [Spirochaetia bacterium]